MSKKLAYILVLGSSMGILLSVASAYVHSYRDRQGPTLSGGEIMGGDFICFYAAGRVFNQDRTALYNYKVQRNEQEAVLGEAKSALGVLPFMYPPLVAALFSLFSNMSFAAAYFSWASISILLYGASLALVMRHLALSKLIKLLFIVAALAFTPFSIHALGAGQTSCLGLFIYALTFDLLKRNKEGMAGTVLAFAYYKPPLFLMFILLVLFMRRRKVIIGFFVTSLILWAATAAVVGGSGVVDYFTHALSYIYGSEVVEGIKLPPEKGVGLFALISIYLAAYPATAKTVFLALFIGALTWIGRLFVRASRGGYAYGEEKFNLMFAVGAAASLLFSIQMIVYDLTLLIVPFLLTASYALKHRTGWAGILMWFATAGLFWEVLFSSVSLAGHPVRPESILFLLWVFSAAVILHRSCGKEMRV